MPEILISLPEESDTNSPVRNNARVRGNMSIKTWSLDSREDVFL